MVKNPKMTTDENLNAADVVVIVSLWVLKFFDSWIQKLFEHTAQVIYGDYMDSQFIERYAIILLFAKSALACAVAFVVDAYNHKFAVAFAGLASYVLTPILALCMCITEKLVLPAIWLAASSVIFVTSPAAFAVIFNQKKFPVRLQVRRLVSIMEFAEGVLQIIVEETIPQKATHNERYSMIASWVVVIPVFVLILTIFERIRKYVRRDIVKEKGVVAIFKGIRNDVGNKPPKTGLSKINLLFFVFLLFPAFSLSSLSSVVSNLKPENDTQFQHPSLKKTIKFGQLTVIPLCEVVVSFSPLRELTAEMLVLGLAHVLNICVLTFLVVRMNGGGGSPSRPAFSEIVDRATDVEPRLLQTFAFPSTSVDSGGSGTTEIYRDARDEFLPPGEKTAVFYVINPTPIRVSLTDDPRYSMFTPDETTELGPERGAAYGNIIMATNTKTISITVNPVPITAAPPFSKSVTFEEKKFYFIILTGNSSKLDFILAGDDVEVPEIITNPVLIVQNTFVGAEFWGRKLEEDHELQVVTGSGKTIYIETLPDRKHSLALVLPVGENVTLTLRYLGKDPIVKEKLGIPLSQTFTACEPKKTTKNRANAERKARCDIESSTFNIINANVRPKGGYFFGVFVTVFEKKPPTTTPAPPEPDQPDAAMQATYAVIGATIGLTSVGYIHFFWMGCPVRLRATLYAWFLASNEILGWLAAHLVGEEIGIEEGVGLLTMAVITAIWHFVFGWYYEHKIMPAALDRRRTPSTEAPD